MKTMWRVLSDLCAAVLALTAVLGTGVTPIHAQTCTELLIDGGFETGAGWQLGPSPVMPQYVTYTRHSGNRSLSLGITSGANIESFSSARQTVAIPAAAPQVLLSFWFYAMADSPATTDYMEVVLLDATGTVILNKPWRSHNDSRVWNQMTFDLTPWQGQTVQLYFNVYNDGLGGRAALFLDDASLAVCTGSATVAPTGTTVATATTGPTTLTPAPSPTPGCVTAVLNGNFESGLTGWTAQGDPRGITLSTIAPHGGSTALRLGALDQSINDFTSVRQQVTIPAGFAQVKLEFWTYTFLEVNPGNDYQRAELLNLSGSPFAVLWNEATNKQAWERREVDLAAHAGQTVFLRFGVNNDGSGGRAAMYLDDVLIRACNPAPVPTATPTPTGTPAATATPTATGVAPTYTTVPPGCLRLEQNGDFESGLLPWRRGASALPAAIVSAPLYHGAYAVRLGSQTENANTYSSIRQTVTAPWGRPRVVVSFWAYTWTESLTGADRQQFAVLGTDGVVWALPWSVLEDAPAWQQYVFDIDGAAGQAFDLYFNAINDGVGGRTALFVDKVEAWACTAGAYPPSLGGSGAIPAMTRPPEITGQSLDGAAGLTPAAVSTTVSLLITPQPLTGLSVATETPTSPPKTPGEDTPTTVLKQLQEWLRGLITAWSLGRILIVAGIAAVLLFILALARRKQT